MHVKTYIHYSTKDLLASCKVCLCFLLLYMNWYFMLWLFNFSGEQIFVDFLGFLSMTIYEVLYT